MLDDYVIESEKVGSFTIKVMPDDDPSSPRYESNYGTFLGFPHRSYDIGDERWDPSCVADQHGRIAWSAIVKHIKRNYHARVVLPVGMLDHSGVTYYIGGDAHWCDPGGWDSGICGVIFDTPHGIKECYGEPDEKLTDEFLTKRLTEEIETYSIWASGGCVGYTITDVNGAHVESCWGFYSVKDALDEARLAVPDTEPERTFLVPVTTRQLTTLGLDVTSHVRLTAEQLTTLGMEVPSHG